MLTGVFRLEFSKFGDVQIYKKGKPEPLVQRINKRKRMEGGDPRVDLCHDRLRRSCHVSQLVWMYHHECLIPEGFEIHHMDEDRMNNSFHNLICVSSLDHAKLHCVTPF